MDAPWPPPPRARRGRSAGRAAPCRAARRPAGAGAAWHRPGPAGRPGTRPRPARGARSARSRSWRGRAASWPKPTWRWRCATWTGPTKRWNPPARPCCGTATSPTPRMPGCCMRGACCCWAVPTTPPSPSRAGIRRARRRAGGACLGRRRHRAAPPAGRTRPAGAGPGPGRRARIRYRRAASRGRCAVAPAGGPGGQADPPRRAAPAAPGRSRGADGPDALVADTARQALRSPMATVDLSRRPVLFALARQLAEAWPGDAPREALIAVFACGGPTRPIAPGCGWRPAGCASRSRAWPRSGPAAGAMRWPCHPAAKP